jgi:uncharacterized protein
MTEQEIDSPCNGDCVIDQETGYCQGCQRTMTEITRWRSYDAGRKQEIYSQLDDRRNGLVGPADD